MVGEKLYRDIASVPSEKGWAPTWGTEAVHDTRKAHRSVEHVWMEKMWQLEGPLPLHPVCHGSLRSLNRSLFCSCWRVSYYINRGSTDPFMLLNGGKFKEKRHREGTAEIMSFSLKEQERGDWEGKNSCATRSAAWFCPSADHLQDCKWSKRELYFFPVSLSPLKDRIMNWDCNGRYMTLE